MHCINTIEFNTNATTRVTSKLRSSIRIDLNHMCRIIATSIVIQWNLQHAHTHTHIRGYEATK